MTREKRGLLIIFAILSLLLGWLSYRAVHNANVNESQDRKIDQLVDENQTQATQLVAQANELEDAIAQGADVSTPAEIAEEIPGATAPTPGPQGDRGEAGRPPTADEIEQAVVAACRDDIDCVGQTGPQGVQGETGIPGRPPTSEEILDAVVKVCGGSCVGPAGSDGQDGQSIVGPQGEPGPGPTAEQVAAAVAAYCSTGACTGPAGADGRPGPGPTEEQVAAAVAAHCSSGACTGPAGAQGEPGRAPTAEEIAAAVSAWFSSHQFVCEHQEGQTYTCRPA